MRRVNERCNEGVGSNTAYLTRDDNTFLMTRVFEHNLRFWEEVLEGIHAQEYKVGDLFCTCVDGGGKEHSVILHNAQVTFRWLKGRSGYYRCYKMSADLMKELDVGDWKVYPKKGNHPEFNNGYHICTDLTTGEEMRFANWGEIERDMIMFQASNYHYREFLEDILGVGGGVQ